MDYYIRVIEDPFAGHPTRGYSKHNMWSLTNKVFRVSNPSPVLEEVVSTIDGSVSKLMCYIISRKDFLSVCPQLENIKSETFAIPQEFALLCNTEATEELNKGVGTKKLTGMEESIRISKRWAQEAEKRGITSPFILRR
jgi:hypothetical protein